MSIYRGSVHKNNILRNIDFCRCNGIAAQEVKYAAALHVLQAIHEMACRKFHIAAGDLFWSIAETSGWPAGHIYPVADQFRSAVADGDIDGVLDAIVTISGNSP